MEAGLRDKYITLVVVCVCVERWTINGKIVVDSKKRESRLKEYKHAYFSIFMWVCGGVLSWYMQPLTKLPHFCTYIDVLKTVCNKLFRLNWSLENDTGLWHTHTHSQRPAHADVISGWILYRSNFTVGRKIRAKVLFTHFEISNHLGDL